MKALDDLQFPGDVRYSDDHEWVKTEGDTVRVGISDYAQDQMGDIVFVELPPVGSSVGQGASFGVVESVKSVSDMLMPVAGEIMAVNDALNDSPQLVNSDPYVDGWMLVVKPEDPAEYDGLMSREAYIEFLKGSE